MLPGVSRRVFCYNLDVGVVRLEPAEAHHLRHVLRVEAGETVELFDAAGRSASAVVETADANGVTVRVESIVAPPATAAELTVATAIPKADRADWMVEKLSELGVTRWIPLTTARSVVHPSGDAKFTRWRRIAVEAAKQSRRPGVMQITRMLPIGQLSMSDFNPGGPAIVLSTRAGCSPLTSTLHAARPTLLLVGPEGGWTETELDSIVDRGAHEASLTNTVLRIETAAVVAAGVVLSGPRATVPGGKG